MHEQIFIAALVFELLLGACRFWYVLEQEFAVVHPALAIPPGVLPPRKKKGLRARYPSGFP